MSRARDILILVVISVALAVAATWPLGWLVRSHLAGHIDHPDVQVGVWWPHAVAESLLRGESLFFRKELNWPDGFDTSLMLWNVAPQLVMAPLHWFAAPNVAFNLGVILVLALNGVASGWAAWTVTGSRAAAVAGAAIGATNGFAVSEGAYGRPEQALWAPAAVYFGALVRLLREPGSGRWAAVAGAGMALAGACYWFTAYFLVVLTAIATAYWAFRRTLDRRRVLDFAKAAGWSVIVVAPFLWPVVMGTLEGGARFSAFKEAHGDAVLNQLQHSATLGSFLGYFGRAGGDPDSRFPLLAMPLCALCAWRATGPIRVMGCFGLLAAVLSLGPIAQTDRGDVVTLGGRLGFRLPMAALNLLPGYDRLWWPYRWQGVAMAATAIAAGWAISTCRRSWLAVAALAAWSVLEVQLLLRGGLNNWVYLYMPMRVPSVFLAIEEMGGTRPILQFPLAAYANSMVIWNAWHGQPIDGGLAWQWDAVRPEGWTRRCAESPLWIALLRIADGRDPEPHPTPWTAEQSAGFHYVVTYPERIKQMDIERYGRISRLLGEPIEEDPMVIAWVVPGVGEAPPGFETSR